MSLFFVLVYKKPLLYLLRKLKLFFEMHHVGSVQFYWHYINAVTVIQADSRLVDVLRCFMMKRTIEQQEEDTREDFFFFPLWSLSLKLGAFWSQLK